MHISLFVFQWDRFEGTVGGLSIKLLFKCNESKLCIFVVIAVVVVHFKRCSAINTCLLWVNYSNFIKQLSCSCSCRGSINNPSLSMLTTTINIPFGVFILPSPKATWSPSRARPLQETSDITDRGTIKMNTRQPFTSATDILVGIDK